jgi:hypothetical protein
MPRISMYKPERGNDYKFMDRQVSEMFQVGGVDIYLHKYMGPQLKNEGTADQPVYDVMSVTNIQDLLFLENRDRKYDEEIYRIRGHYQVQNIDFNLSQFGLFLDNDTVMMTVHINDFIKYIGRKPLSGDVLEFPNLRDEFALNDYDLALPRYYVVEDVGRASEGFSATWYPHLYRLRLKKIVDQQQFADILNKPAMDSNGDPTDMTLRDLLSTHSKELEINDQIVAQAEADAAKSGYETRQFYTLAVDEQGKPVLNTASDEDILASENVLASQSEGIPERTGYTGYLVGDGFPVNGYDFGFGIQFPATAVKDDFFLRTDFLPNRLHRFDGARWVKVEDAVRMNMTNNDTRATQKTAFINNTNYMYTDATKSDVVTLAKDATTINTTIDPSGTAAFVVIKLDTYTIEYAVSSYPGLITNYSYLNPKTGITSSKVRINLPTIATVQQQIPYAGKWTVTFYKVREEQRQSLSKALRPKADL